MLQRIEVIWMITSDHSVRIVTHLLATYVAIINKTLQETLGCLEYNTSHLNATIYTLQNSTSQLKSFANDCSSLSSCEAQINISHPQAQYYNLQLQIIMELIFGQNSYRYSRHDIRKCGV